MEIFSFSRVDLVQCCGVWYWGLSGVDKTRKALMYHPVHYVKSMDECWDGYQGQDVVILDDVRLNHVSWIGSFLLLWTSNKSFSVKSNGRDGIQICPKKVVVTSNYSIQQLFAGDEHFISCLLSRFAQVQIHS